MLLESIPISSLIWLIEPWSLAHLTRPAIERALLNPATPRMTRWRNYVFLRRLGKGVEGTTYAVLDTNRASPTYKHVCALKFCKSITDKRFKTEVVLHKRAARHGLAPKIYLVDTHQRVIIMQWLKTTLYHIFTSQNRTLSRDQQRAIIALYHKLDRISIFHNDPNPLNLMCGHEQPTRWYVIDFGRAQEITESLARRWSLTPNESYMTVGLMRALGDAGATKRFSVFERRSNAARGR